ncbi:PAS domain-containing protein [Croceitalea sp. P059]|uniref:PAS domain-containing sensor histidine kinase n=1 Tax=Croceitalea sp. P059 TaxID=3075601 RepID=UPI0028876839|nr:PAS domain-containing protein [Croceitalea sp. P059]MDT0541022.1 PAS domain-containing protein [Croceitalea sp. P059]
MKTNTLTTHGFLIKQLPTATAFIDTTFKIVYASDKWMEYFNLEYHNSLSKHLLEIFTDNNKEWKDSIESCFKGNTEQGLQSTKNDAGKEKWFEWSNSPWYDDNENIVGAIIQTDDVTHRIASELKLDKLENLLKDQSEISKVGTWEYNIITEEVTWSEMTKKILGVAKDFKPNLESALNFYKRGHNRNTVAMVVHNGIEKGESWNIKSQILTPKGKEKWVVSAGKPLYKEGKVTRLIGTFQDISTQVEAEIKTKESEQLLRTLVDNLPLNVYIKDTESRKVLVNQSECDYLGVTNPKELIGKTDADLYGEEIATISRDEDLHVMNSKKSIIAKRTVNIKKDGKSTSFLTSKLPWLDIHGQSQGIIGISLDINELIQKEDQLRDLINVTAIQNKKLINFAHIVSHNLRSHTANFSMLLDFLINEKVEEEKTRIMDMLSHASVNLMDTLENLNEVVDISTNVNLEKKPIGLNEQITKVEQSLSAFLHKNKVKLTNHILDDITVKAVPAYIESIVLNLMTNAVKYKHPERDPRIILSARKLEDNTILFSIQDNGMGIDLNKYGKKLFGMYKTFHNNSDARGIGLYLVKNQIEAMGGNIVATSEVDKGSTFSVYFNDKD